MKTSEVLNRAADLIEERGWGRGASTWRAVGGVCIEGAVGLAMGRVVNSYDKPNHISPDDLQLCPAGQALRDYLSDWFTSNRDTWWLCHWNDDDERTDVEVIETLRACALIEASREDQDAAFATYAQNVVSA